VRLEARQNGRRVIKRALPRQNEVVNGLWICDKGRFGYHYTEDPERLTQPLLRKDSELVPVTWDEALDAVADQLRKSDSQMAALAGGRLSNEDLFNFRRLTQALDGSTLLDTCMAGGDLTAQVGAAPGTDLSSLGKGSLVMVIASDLHEEAPIWWLQLKQAAEHGATILSINPRWTRLDEFAAHAIRYAYGDEVQALRVFLPSEDIRTLPFGLAAARRTFEDAQDVLIFFGSEGTGYEASALLARTAAELLVRTDHYGRANNGLVGVWQNANTQGAWDMGFRPAASQPDALQNARLVYVAGADPAGDDLAWVNNLKKTEFLVVQDLFLTATAKLANVVLPASAYTEREGSYTNGLRRVQRFYPAAGALPGPRADFAIFAQLAERFGLGLDKKSAANVFQNISRRTPGYTDLSYSNLAHFEKQFPLVGRTAMYYGGTIYDNEQGMGAPLPLTALGTWAKLDAELPPPPPDLPEGALLIVPVTYLYDRGTGLSNTPLLEKRRSSPALRIHPQTAAELGLAETAQAVLPLASGDFPVAVCLDEKAPRGVGLLPRSVGVPLTVPRALIVRGVVKEI